MKIKVTEKFQYEGKEYEEGSVVDLPESVARSILEKGYGKEAEEVPEIGAPEESAEAEAPDTGGKIRPEWKRKIWISEDRNFSISVWPPGGKFDSPSVTLEENRRDDSGNWTTDRTYLPTGSSLLALSEHLKSAWDEVQEIRNAERE